MTSSASIVSEVPDQVAQEQRSDVEALFDRYSVCIYRYIAVRVGRNSTVADELMQQLWLQVVKSDPQLPVPEFEFWLRRVAANLVREHWRRQKRKPPHVSLGKHEGARDLTGRMDNELLPPEVAQQREVMELLALAVTGLPADDQELIVKHYMKGTPFESLAQEYGLTRRAVEGRLYRARQKLKEQLAHLEEAL